ncbi:MAG: hypothetical protein CL840_18795 [Crocinitomicaceae bacterium]|nr:hypothetical protein [Crocinitomicaceae bacterium]
MKKIIIACVLISQFLTGFSQENITLIGKLSITGLPIHEVWGYVDTVTGKQYALLCASTSGLRIIDVSDPSNPTLVGTISGNGLEAVDVKTWKNYAYVVAESPSVSGKIIDLTNPSGPVQSGSFPGGHNITISDSGYMYLSAPGIRIFDLNSDPLNPALVYTDSTCDGHDISIVNQLLYDFSDNCGTRIFDISQPDTLISLGTVPSLGMFHHSGWPSANGNYLFICDELASPNENDITVWDISDITNPLLVDSFSDPNAYVHNLYVEANYAFVSYYRAGFRVFNIADPTNIFLAAEYDTDSLLSGPGYGGNFGVYIFWGTNKILASDEENGLYIFSFTNVNTGLSESENIKTDGFRIYPNPTNGSSVLEYSLNRKGNVEVGIYNLEGKLIHVFNEGMKQEGSHQFLLPVKQLEQGMYIVKMKANTVEKSMRFIIPNN